MLHIIIAAGHELYNIINIHRSSSLFQRSQSKICLMINVPRELEFGTKSERRTGTTNS